MLQARKGLWGLRGLKAPKVLQAQMELLARKALPAWMEPPGLWDLQAPPALMELPGLKGLRDLLAWPALMEPLGLPVPQAPWVLLVIRAQ